MGCTTGASSFTPGQDGPRDRRNRLPRVDTPGIFRGSEHDSLRQAAFFSAKKTGDPRPDSFDAEIGL